MENKLKKEAKQIVQEVFQNMGEMYESIFKTYYPSHNSNGFTERNLTFYFSHCYLKRTKKSDIIIWQEVPIRGGEHFDTLIIDTVNEMIFIIEAKRLQNVEKYNSIEKDFIRILNCFKKIKKGEDIVKIPEKYSDYQKFALLLADIWIPESNENKINLKEKFEIFSSISNVLFVNKSREIKSMKKWSDEKYFLIYNLFKIDEILINYSIQDDSIIKN